MSINKSSSETTWKDLNNNVVGEITKRMDPKTIGTMRAVSTTTRTLGKNTKTDENVAKLSFLSKEFNKILRNCEKLKTRFRNSRQVSDDERRRDLRTIDAAIDLIRPITKYALPNEVIHEILNGAFHIIMELGTLKYALRTRVHQDIWPESELHIEIYNDVENLANAFMPKRTRRVPRQ